MTRDIKKIVSQLTLEEKAGLCSGLNFWHTKGVERLDIPSVMVTDGPHGLRKQSGSSDHLGLLDSVPATCFPSAAGLACSWDVELVHQVGIALGEECQAEDVAVLLGPGANIKRSPLCGRNFEYFSEDPYLSSEMAAAHINGVQSQGVGTSLKHFAVNNQEHRRMTVDAIVDERTLREIYLASFEGAVIKAQPWTVMSSYNQVNGDFASENSRLLTDILKQEWGHQGFVVSDWGAVNERAAGLAAGLELEMPSSNGAGDRKIVEAVQAGLISEAALNDAVERILTVVFKSVDNKKENAAYDAEAHHQLAMKVAAESMVLLKNDQAILPLAKSGSIAVIGAFADAPRYQGGGSSHIKPTKLDNTYAEIVRTAGETANVSYAQGYKLENDDSDEQLLQEAKNTASQADTVVLFLGLPDRYESEGYDRQHLNIPNNQLALLEAVTEVQQNLVIVLSNGSPIVMPWLGKAKAVLEGYLGGQAVGGAIAAILFGDANPSGKLAETFPVKLSDNPSFLNFPGEGDKVEYKEGVFVGYRYYDTKEVEPLFPFGFGLSYTSFAYSNLIVDKTEFTDQDTVTVTVDVTNTGTVTGKEIVQLYVRDSVSTVIRPAKELKGFSKIELQPGEKKNVSFQLSKRAFAYYHVGLKDWHVETGEFEILVGASSRDIACSQTVQVQSTVSIRKPVTMNTTFGDLLQDPERAAVANGMLQQFSEGSGMMSSLMEDAPEMMEAMLNFLPLRALAMFSQGAVTEEAIGRVIAQMNEMQPKAVLVP
ncbi:glycoside hydrolase family 3 C-terminal domain-containing protein [Paenibacillus sp. LHD-38]|uniref:beta-glucosidase family protein n=1 Tax=Paenibacillus sp. LHD-38 TaxID=3072143 RepID=UPI00280E6624|nr:glycoside hydrolase family 3 C-terminal domain-containing protein [Paenibacillus sp. LHD-38]MDQ8733228.1 glycoside hydrolase family 3 C-terminal domain-containing protein [Paenibacillus sp. LHD-38]